MSTMCSRRRRQNSVEYSRATENCRMRSAPLARANACN